MTLFNLIEKEVKEFFTNKIYVVTMFIFPLIFIIIMGTTLDGHMSMDNNIFRHKTIYYKISNCDDNQLKSFYNFMIEFEKKTNVNFIKTDKSDVAIESVNNDEAISFVDLNGDSYKYFRSENKESSESKIFRNVFEQYYKKYFLIETIPMNGQISISLISENISQEEVNSFTYYTFTQLTLIIFYISIIISISMYKDKNSYIMIRLKNFKFKNASILISKIVLGLIIGVLQTIIIYLVSTKFLDVSWGQDLLTIFIILILLIIFSSILGMFIFTIFSNYKTAIRVSNILIIIMGFLGGAYVPIYLVKSSNVASFLSLICPTYWINISLISLSKGINSNHHIILITFLIGISILILGYVISQEK